MKKEPVTEGKTSEDYWAEYSRPNHSGARIVTEANFKAAIRDAQKNASQFKEAKPEPFYQTLVGGKVSEVKEPEPAADQVLKQIEKLAFSEDLSIFGKIQEIQKLLEPEPKSYIPETEDDLRIAEHEAIHELPPISPVKEAVSEVTLPEKAEQAFNEGWNKCVDSVLMLMHINPWFANNEFAKGYAKAVKDKAHEIDRMRKV